MIRKMSIIILLLFLTSPILHAYWDGSNIHTNNDINIGEWEILWINDTIIPGFDLNDWILHDKLNQNIPAGQIFSYNGKLYISRVNTYNPEYHGLPGPNKLYWAYLHTSFDWEPGYNYRTNSVVKIDNRYFIANSANNNDWFISDPRDSINPWDPWREIEQIKEDKFDFYPGTSIRDYSKPDWNYITYK